MKTKEVKTWAELNRYLFANTWNEDIRRFRSPFAYRGLSNKKFKLTTGLTRLGEWYPTMERNLLKQFRKYANRHVLEPNTEWHWLSVAQHHGLPTRLLDWTYSPLVALHFATEDIGAMDVDSAVWKINYAKVNRLLQKDLIQKLATLGAEIFSVDALAEAIPTLDSLDHRSSKDHEIAVFFEPPSLDERIVNQFGYFSALSDPKLSMEEWLIRPGVEGKVDALKIIIPKRLKWEIRDKLDQSNINERVLMGGTDGLCKWLRRHYMPRPKPKRRLKRRPPNRTAPRSK